MMDGSDIKTRPYKDWPNDAGFEVEIEQREPIELIVKGIIPDYVAGTLYRTGPGDHRIKNTPKGDLAMSHWFDGFTHIYRFQIVQTTEGSCKVFYNSRRQVDDLIEKIRKTGKIDITFGQKRDPCASFFQKLKTVFATRGNTDPYISNVGVTIATNVPGFDELAKDESEKGSKSRFDNVMLFTDTSDCKRLEPETLEPLGVTNQTILHPSLIGPVSSAHPQYDNGDVFNYNLDFGATSSTYRFFKTSLSTGETEILATISGADAKSAYIHSFFLTPDFVILAIWPSYFSGGGMSILWTRNVVDAIAKFNPAHKTKWIVVDRKHGRGHIATYESAAAFSFHSINAWQEPQEDGTIDVFCDVIQYPNTDIIHNFYYENLMSMAPGIHEWAEDKEKRTPLEFKRYHLSAIPSPSPTQILSSPAPKRGSAVPILSLNSSQIGDLPSHNPAFHMQKQRYVYSLLDRGHSSFVDGIGKTDLETQTLLSWEAPHHTPGEPVFVGKPGAEKTPEGEDDGVILSVVLDGDKGTSYLLVLDAKTMQEVARAEVGVVVGFGFHGRHYKL